MLQQLPEATASRKHRLAGSIAAAAVAGAVYVGSCLLFNALLLLALITNPDVAAGVEYWCHGCTYPPVRVEDGKAEVVHDLVVVVIAVSVDFDTNREALNTEVEVSTDCTLDADVVRDVPVAVVAVVQGPVGKVTVDKSPKHELRHRGMLLVLLLVLTRGCIRG